MSLVRWLLASRACEVSASLSTAGVLWRTRADFLRQSYAACLPSSLLRQAQRLASEYGEIAELLSGATPVLPRYLLRRVWEREVTAISIPLWPGRSRVKPA